MKTDKELKDLVKQKYSEIALQDQSENKASCCGSGGCSTEVYNIMSDSYETIEGYNPEADLGLGCGLPTAFALIKEGDTVLDLGSGAGNDCFVARAQTGEKGKVIGVDLVPDMLQRAKVNLKKTSLKNVTLQEGPAEQLPFPDGTFDVVISNGVFNLIPDKAKALGEVFRVLKPSARFQLADQTLIGETPADTESLVKNWAG